MLPSRDLSSRPLALGEVIDRAAALTVRHFRVLFSAMLALHVPVVALYRWFAADFERASAAMISRPNAWMAMLPVGAKGLALVAALLMFQWVATSAVAAVIAPSLEGHPVPTPGAAGHLLLRRAAPATATAAAQLFTLLAALLAGALPGAALFAATARARPLGAALAVLGSILAGLLALLRLVLAPAITGVEGLAGPRALRRSIRLMAPRPGAPLRERPGLRASILLLAVFLLAATVGGLVGLPRALLALAFRADGPGPTALLPLGVEIALGIFEGVASSAVQPFSLAAIAVFYFDRRARTEGDDLERWADRLSGERAA